MWWAFDRQLVEDGIAVFSGWGSEVWLLALDVGFIVDYGRRRGRVLCEGRQ
jgi:hypothetical protein